jgi:transcriptional regulator with XRE-family HTH domain
MFDNTVMKTLSQYIANSKVKRTQEEWAKFLGISRRYLLEILSGEVTPGWKTIAKIHEATGGKVPATAWLKREDAA